MASVALVIGALGPADAQVRTDRYIVVLEDSVTEPATVAADHADRYGAVTSHVYRHAFKGYAADIPDGNVGALERDSRVASVTRDRVFTFAGKHKSSRFKEGKPFEQVVPPGIDRIDADLSSARSGDGRGTVDVNVAVVDSGIDTSHPDLNVAGGTNCAKPGAGVNDVLGHGTLVAGVIGARDDSRYLVGVAPGARLWSVVIFDKKGYANERSLLCGLDWLTATRTDADPTNDIAVVNLSIEGPGEDDRSCGSVDRDALHEAVCRAVAAGVTVVAAAGNDGVDLKDTTPAAYQEVLTVTAMADHDGRAGGLGRKAPCPSGRRWMDDGDAYFSNFAKSAADVAHTVAAPGSCVLSTFPRRNAAYASGTSLAAPHVAGVAALCIARGACTGTPSQIVSKLVADAAAYSAANPGYGFAGDPQHPYDGVFFGPLVRAALY